jgi:hypothetical protein
MVLQDRDLGDLMETGEHTPRDASCLFLVLVEFEHASGWSKDICMLHCIVVRLTSNLFLSVSCL